MLGAAGVVDRIARAEIVEPVRDAGMLAPRQQQRVHQPVARNGQPLDAIELGVDEADIERRVVNHQRRIADELQKLIDNASEQRLVGQEFAGQAVHGECFRRHVAFGIDVTMKCLSGRHAVEDFDATDFDQPIAAQRVEAGGFGIENDFAHDCYPAAGESGPPPRHLSSLAEDFPDSRPHRIKAMRRIHHKIGASALFGYRAVAAPGSHRASRSVMLSRARMRWR